MKSRSHVDYKPSTRGEHKNPMETPISMTRTNNRNVTHFPRTFCFRWWGPSPGQFSALAAIVCQKHLNLYLKITHKHIATYWTDVARLYFRG